MPTFSAFPAEDGYWRSSGTFNTNGSDFVAGYGGSTTYGAFFRWTNVTIPAGSTAAACVMDVTKNSGSGTCNIRVSFEAADNPTFPTDLSDAQGRTVTSNYAHINTAPSNGAYQTPDFTASAQEIIDRGGWASGQAMQVHWRDFAGTGTATFQGRCIERTGTSEDPSISITYTEPAAGNPWNYYAQAA
jgi:hypothetical protein